LRHVLWRNGSIFRRMYDGGWRPLQSGASITLFRIRYGVELSNQPIRVVLDQAGIFGNNASCQPPRSKLAGYVPMRDVPVNVAVNSLADEVSGE